MSEALKQTISGTSPVQLFQGFSTLEADSKSTAVKGTSESAGTQSRMQGHVFTEMTEILQETGVETAFSAGFANVFETTTKVGFFRSMKMTSLTTVIMLHVTRITDSQQATTWEIDERVDQPATEADTVGFFKTYGDSFIKQIDKGGEFIATMMFHSNSIEQKQRVETALSAKGVVGSFSFGTDVSTTVNDVRTETQTELTFDIFVSGIKNYEYPAMDADSLMEAAKKFTTATIDDAKVINFELESYNSLPKIGPLFRKIKDNRNFFTGIGLQGGLFDSLVELDKTEDDIGIILDLYEYYSPPTRSWNPLQWFFGSGGFQDSKLNRAAKNLEEDKNKIKSLITAFLNNPIEPLVLPDLTTDFKMRPVFRAKLFRGTTAGGDGGDHDFTTILNDKEITEWMFNRSRISKVEIHTGEWVNDLAITYELMGGETKKRQASKSRDDVNRMRWHETEVKKGDRVRGITVHIGEKGDGSERTHAIRFDFHDADPLKGGKEFGTPHLLHRSGGTHDTLFGVYGRMGHEIDKIGALFGRLQEADWIERRRR